MQKPLLLWDFDGVMADSTNFVFAYWQKQLNAAGYEFELADYQATFTYKFPFDYLHEHYSDVAPQIYKSYSAYEDKHYATQVGPFSGFLEGFAQIADQYQHHLISSNLKSVIEPWLKLHQLENHFTSIIGRETPGYKDKKITTLLGQLNREPHEAIFVGDTISDIEHAHSAGIQNIAVSWGVHSRAQLEFSKPDRICDTLEELFLLLKNGAT